MGDRPRLTYFNLRGLGEPIRMMLTYGGIAFEDVRIEYGSEDWKKRKTNYPMGQVPYLEIDGLKLSQGRAICRYLAKKMKLLGDDAAAQAEVDSAGDVIYDFIAKMRVIYADTDEKEQGKKYEDFKTNVIPVFLKYLEGLAEKNNGHLAAKKLTWVDFYFAGMIDYLQYLCKMNFTEDPKWANLRKVVENVKALPQLASYMKTRPESPI